MLDAMRKRAGSWIVKAFLGLLILSFAVWGIGDYMTGGQAERPVAKVGQLEIHQRELSDAFRDRLMSLERQLGTSIDREQAIAMGMMEQALQDLIARRLLDQGAAEMGLTIADDTVRRYVVENPMFHGPGGFDRQRFNAILMQAGLSEEGYIQSVRRELLRSRLIDSLVGNVEAPEAMARAIYTHRGEQRAGSLLVVERGLIEDVPEPADEDLQAFLDRHEDRYTAPEYRGITLVPLRPEDLRDEIEISDAALAAAYRDRERDFATPGRREVAQLLAEGPDLLERARGLLADGRSLDEVAAELGDDVIVDDLGAVGEGELPGELEEVVFALGEGGIGGPVESAFGWHLFRVGEIRERSVRPLAEVADALRAELLDFEAIHRLPSLANALDDELAAGVEVEEAADGLGLEVVRIEAVDAQGRDPDGARAQGLPDWPEVIETAFATPVGETSLLVDVRDAYFVLRVDEVIPPRVYELEEVREEVGQAWQEDWRDRRARELAGQLRGRASEVAELERLAEAPYAVLRSFGPIDRQSRGAGLSAEAVALAFASRPGRVAGEVAPVAGGYAVLVVEEVIEADPDADPAGVARVRAQLTDEMRDDIVVQLEAALRRSFPVERDDRRLGGLM
jgi:peptidyl-prolyl cis-trans isomerase D